MDRREISYIRVIVESYDGMAIVKTIDPQAALIELQVSQGCESMVFELLGSLVEDEGMHLTQEKRISYC